MSIKAYTYLIKCLPTGECYYGVRYAAGCCPDDLWKSYFTSSRKVKERIKMFGKDAFKTQIRRTFDTTSAARLWEHKVLRRLKIHNNAKWLNISTGMAAILQPRSRKNYRHVYILSNKKYTFLPLETATRIVEQGLGIFQSRPKPPQFGIKISAALKGRPKSIQHIKKRSITLQCNRQGCTFQVYNDGTRDFRLKSGDVVPKHLKRGSVRKGRSIPNQHKGKTYNEIYGEQQAARIKEIRSKKFKQSNPSQKIKGKTYEEIYGVERAAELRKLRQCSRNSAARS